MTERETLIGYKVRITCFVSAGGGTSSEMVSADRAIGFIADFMANTPSVLDIEVTNKIAPNYRPKETPATMVVLDPMQARISEEAERQTAEMEAREATPDVARDESGNEIEVPMEAAPVAEPLLDKNGLEIL